MLYPEFVKAVATSYKERGISTAIETCGFVPWKNFEMVADQIDLVMFDLKIMDDEKHRKYCGGSNERILQNLEKISQKVETVVRMPIIPGINDSVEDIDAAGDYLKNLLGKGGKVHILAYHNLGEGKYNALCKPYLLKGLKAPEDEHMQDIKNQLENYGLKVQIGG